MRAAIYARKSTDQSGTEARSVARQIEACERFAASKAWTVVDRFQDDAVSGALFATRPGFQRMLRAAEAGTFEALLLWDLDRFGRSSRRTMEALHALRDVGVEVWDVAAGQPIELDSWGEASTFLKALVAQEFRQSIRRHTVAALRRQAEAGKATGGAPYGYRNERRGPRDSRRVVHEPEAKVVRQMFKRFADGASLYGVTAWLNGRKVKPPRGKAWAPNTVRFILGNPAYRGRLTYGKSATKYGARELGDRRTTVDGRTRETAQLPAPEETWIVTEHPSLRIIDDALWEYVADRLAERGRISVKKPSPGRGTHLLSGGLLICPECGGAFETYQRNYVCATRRRKKACTNLLRLPIEKTDRDIIDVLDRVVLSPAAIDELLGLVADGADERPALEADLARLRTEVRRLLDSIADGVPAASVAGMVREKEAEIGRIEARLRAPRPGTSDRSKLRAALEGTSADWAATLRKEPAVARVVIRKLIGPITLWKHEKRPEWLWKATAKNGLLDEVIPTGGSRSGSACSRGARRAGPRPGRAGRRPPGGRRGARGAGARGRRSSGGAR
jgi:DNA invertase Pin-like site-specific DNA recombinase